MTARHLSPSDRLLGVLDNALRTVIAGERPARRANPAREVPDAPLSDEQRRHAAGLMRVNHAGEVAAQALYQGHAAVAKSPEIAEHMRHAADEEQDHLHWCEQRLAELGAAPSRLSPFWYAGGFAIGAASGVLGDRWSLGFVVETERQVEEHLNDHLERLPPGDRRSRAIVATMREEEAAHGAAAERRGAAALPAPVRNLMRASAKFMKGVAYWL